MSASTHTPSCIHSAAQQAPYYEALREHAMARLPAIVRHGLAVLLRQGVAVWMGTRSKVPAAATRSRTADITRPSPVPDGVKTELLGVLVAMTLAHIQQVHP